MSKINEVCPECDHKWSFEIQDHRNRKRSEIGRFGLRREYEVKKLCPKCHPQSSEVTGVNSEMDIEKKQKLDVEVRVPRFELKRDVILTPETETQIDEAIVKIKFHKRIYEEWDFASVDPSGKGLIINFYGKPGTGKTIAAEALAGTLGNTFISLGMSDVESKFMGDTAKNIRMAFEAANHHNSILFFDEADTLLGKRLSNVTQGIDNEVNSMRSTLLIELERFEGVVIFASNFASNYDKAFQSRISQHVHFDIPGFEGRKALWAKHLVEKIPIEGDRSELIESLATGSEGLVGRDIRTCIRLALPKAIMEEEATGSPAHLKQEHLMQAIQQVNKSIQEVGSDVSGELKVGSNLLGVKIKKEN